MTARGCLRPAKGGVLLDLRVSPGARKTSVEGTYGEGALKLKVAAPPVDGRANAEVLRFLAKLFDVPRSRVAVVRGASGRDKVVLVEGGSPEGIRASLADLAG